jgi:ADP-dependent NAD(P)H-hydrate dehydratase / NAD(P)H-hydrate epimerase
MPLLPTAIHSAEQVRAIERRTMENGTSSWTLMSRGGAAALAVLREKWPQAKEIAIACGSGNNGGDGYALARFARQSGLSVTVFALADPEKLQGDARTAWREYRAAGGQVSEWSTDRLAEMNVLVDAIFGIGLTRPVAGELAAAIEAMNESGVPILALDIPSGVCANTGRVLGIAVRARCTVTFVALKIGLFLNEAPNHVGQLEFATLDVSDCSATESVAERLDVQWLRSALPRRPQLSHKGSNGRVLLIGGGPGMGGAIRLAGEACLRVGAGLVHVATHSGNVSAIVSTRPELIVHGIEVAADIEPLIADADVIAIGPGLGQDDWARWLLKSILKTEMPIVMDADALNLLAQSPQHRNNWIMTPHPGEAARLLATSIAAVQQDRLGSVTALANKYGGVAILKGKNTVCAQKGELPALCDRGNSAMATAGMGDVLTGVIAGIAAQLDTNDVQRLWNAARAGVLIHAMAGDLARTQLGANVERGLIASDLFAQLPICASSHE